MPELTARQAGGRGNEPILKGENIPRLVDEHGTDLGRANAARKALKQANAQLLLQELDLLAERRLRDAEVFGGMRETAVIGDGYEISQMPEFHVYPLDMDVAMNIYWR
jgi:hypothetical protein